MSEHTTVTSGDERLQPPSGARRRFLTGVVTGGLLAVPLEQTVRIHASSGTRHKPTIVAYTARDIELFADVNARSIACAGSSDTPATLTSSSSTLAANRKAATLTMKKRAAWNPACP